MTILANMLKNRINVYKQDIKYAQEGDMQGAELDDVILSFMVYSNSESNSKAVLDISFDDYLFKNRYAGRVCPAFCTAKYVGRKVLR